MLRLASESQTQLYLPSQAVSRAGDIANIPILRLDTEPGFELKLTQSERDAPSVCWCWLDLYDHLRVLGVASEHCEPWWRGIISEWDSDTRTSGTCVRRPSLGILLRRTQAWLILRSKLLSQDQGQPMNYLRNLNIFSVFIVSGWLIILRCWKFLTWFMNSSWSGSEKKQKQKQSYRRRNIYGDGRDHNKPGTSHIIGGQGLALNVGS